MVKGQLSLQMKEETHSDHWGPGPGPARHPGLPPKLPPSRYSTAPPRLISSTARVTPEMTVLLVCLQLSVVSSQLEGETFVYPGAAQSSTGVATRRSQCHLLALHQDAPSQGRAWLHSHPTTASWVPSPQDLLRPQLLPCPCGHLGAWPSGGESVVG